MNKVFKRLIPYLKIPLNIGDLIFATLANFSKIVFNKVNRVAVGVAKGLQWVAGVARFLGLCGKLCLYDAKNCFKWLFK